MTDKTLLGNLFEPKRAWTTATTRGVFKSDATLITSGADRLSVQEVTAILTTTQGLEGRSEHVPMLS